MTRLSDYLRAETPDETEPVTFYRPGAKSWYEVKRGQPAEPETDADAEEELRDVRDTAGATTAPEKQGD